MVATHEELQQLLTVLEADMPWLLKAYPKAGDFVDAFAEQAGLISSCVGAEDNAWVSAEINRMMASFGHLDNVAL